MEKFSILVIEMEGFIPEWLKAVEADARLCMAEGVNASKDSYFTRCLHDSVDKIIRPRSKFNKAVFDILQRVYTTGLFMEHDAYVIEAASRWFYVEEDRFEYPPLFQEYIPGTSLVF